MRFREEVLAKIFTYITVVVLLGVLIFEAWSLQGERGKRAETEGELLRTEEELQDTAAQKQELETRNKELEAFQTTWSPYAAFVEEKDVFSLKNDLFTRPDLIPGQALEALEELVARREEALEEQLEEQEAQQEKASANSKSSTETDSGQTVVTVEEKAELESHSMEFEFDNPNGENIFLPLSTGTGEAETCLIYTTAFETRGTHVIELIYEISFTSQGSARKDENGELEWNCVAWQIGEGWQGISGEKETE